MTDRYADAEQARDYRKAARERGCTCPDDLPPHVHLPACPLAGEFDPEKADFRLEVSPGSAAAPEPPPESGETFRLEVSPAVDAPPGGASGSAIRDRETEPGEGKADTSPSPGAGDRTFLVSPDGRDWYEVEREEDHAEERHSEGGL